MTTNRWRIVDFSSFEGEVYYSGGQLTVVKEGKRKVKVPLVDVAVILIGPKTMVTGGTIDGVARNGCSLLVCDWKREPAAALHPWSFHTRVAARQRAQASLSVPRQKNAWKMLVQGKIRGQAHNLKAIDINAAQHLEELAKSVHSGDPENVEGTAASYYWRRLFGPDYRRDANSRDNINGALNYAYTILRGHVMRSLTAAGLAPALGIHHKHRGNNFALADDLIEPFRPFVDYHVHTMVEGCTLTDLSIPETKRELVALTQGQFAPGGDTLPTVIQDLCTAFGQYVEGDIQTLPVLYWEGPFVE